MKIIIFTTNHHSPTNYQENNDSPKKILVFRGDGGGGALIAGAVFSKMQRTPPSPLLVHKVNSVQYLFKILKLNTDVNKSLLTTMKFYLFCFV